MAKLYKLLYGRSKKRMRPIMIDEHHKCENYKKAREHTVEGWHEIVEADKDDEVWRKKSCTIGGNKCSNVARITRHGNQVNGWVGKDGFNQHT